MDGTAGFTYALVAGWERAQPELKRLDVSDVAVDSQDRVFLLTRGDAAVLIYERDGTFVKAWGQGDFSERPHGITIGPDDTVYIVDDGSHCVRVYTPDGESCASFGTGPSNPLLDTSAGVEGMLRSTNRGYPPFTRPTKLAIAPDGEFYVSDGYGNARVHRFSADRQLIASWGEPGTKPGQFHVPHSVYIDTENRVLVCDRENDRVQIFSRSGEWQGSWTDFHRPMAVLQDSESNYIVAEGAWSQGYVSQVHGVIDAAQPSRVTILSPGGGVLDRFGAAGDPCDPGSFVSAHGIAIDSYGDLYVAEVTGTVLRNEPERAANCHTLQKFHRL